jgi:hypothetical protein
MTNNLWKSGVEDLDRVLDSHVRAALGKQPADLKVKHLPKPFVIPSLSREALPSTSSG